MKHLVRHFWIACWLLGGLGLLMVAFNVQAQPASPGSGIAPSPAAAASAVTPARLATAPASTAIAPRWGDGVLEREFLVKLRTFLETDPFDFKGFEATFGVRLEVNPSDRPYPDGGWSIGNVRYGYPFGQTFNNRTRGGAYWAFDPGRNSAYLSMEFAKMPPAGKGDRDGQPCMTPELVEQVFDQGWSERTTRYREIRVHLATTQVPGGKSAKWMAGTPQQVWMSYPLETCIPRMFFSFSRLPPYPTTK